MSRLDRRLGSDPGPAWPHMAILGDLTARPAMTPAELGASVVTRFVESYRRGGQLATQSAIDLGQLGDLVEAVDILAHRLLDDLKRAGLVDAIRHARVRTLQFFDGLYLDLHHVAGNLAKAIGPRPVADSCMQIRRVIAGERAARPIIAEAYVAPGWRLPAGLSIYFPAHREPTIHYRELEFAKRTRWADFLDALVGKGRAPEAQWRVAWPGSSPATRSTSGSGRPASRKAELGAAPLFVWSRTTFAA